MSTELKPCPFCGGEAQRATLTTVQFWTPCPGNESFAVALETLSDTLKEVSND